jgi:indolepyruvate ferredoxin oxidoreductase
VGAEPTFANDQTLGERFTLQRGRVFLTGTQALIRAVFEQAQRDERAGLKTAGLISGYRGSPLGGVDLELWRQQTQLDAHGIKFLPAINEDLGATAILGSQQVETSPGKTVDAVFGFWYGKGPGVDRSGDALKHGNAYGSSPRGGVLVVAGDDHGCVSSSMPHQSDVAFMSWLMPVLSPSSIEEYLEFAEYGYALSRFSGMWVGFKVVSETVESAASVQLKVDRAFVQPEFTAPASGLHYRWPDLPGPQIEERMEHKKAAVSAFALANPIDRVVYGNEGARFGIITTGKAHLDVMEALRLLGVDSATCQRLGIDVYKVGMVWPLERHNALSFVQGKIEVLVVEEKRGIIESQLKEYFYDWPGSKPQRMTGKQDEHGNMMIPWTGELTPLLLVPVIAQRLEMLFPENGFAARSHALTTIETPCLSVEGATRTPYFCSGCPHNISTKVPEGSNALAGIGCHFMANWMDRSTSSIIQMGGEGVNWAASSLFTGKPHVFQNLGDGTWYHSGSLAIRQAVAAKTNITFKILYNDAVAMTGGQPVDGAVSVQAIAHHSRAEGIQRIALVSDEPAKFSLAEFPSGMTIHARTEMDKVQRELREVPGVSILIYEQLCATEKRRRRKRGTLDDPKRFAVINDLVCEGCGDCSIESNCLSVEPLETELGTKRKINLSNCNKDFSCLNGFCPSFVTVEGAVRRKQSGEISLSILDALADALPHPKTAGLDEPYNLLVTGVGGTGVVTVGALVTMAAHLEGLGATVLDFTGFAQKFGSVISYIRLANEPSDLNQVRIDERSADSVIACDIVVSTSPKASSTYRSGTQVALNTAVMPTGDMILHRDANLQIDRRQQVIEDTVGSDNVNAFDANQAAESLLGDAVFANVMMMGYAWQLGMIPVSLASLDRAIELNAVQIDKNRLAFKIGRVLSSGKESISQLLPKTPDLVDSLDELIEHRAQYLIEYQNDNWASRFRATMEQIKAVESEFGSEEISKATARSLFKLMSYKDEYEVARLHSQTGFREKLERLFEGDFTVHYHLAPPLLGRDKDHRGRPKKREFSRGIYPAFSVLSKLKWLRGSFADPFGWTAERRMERELIAWFERLITTCCEELNANNHDLWLEIMQSPMNIRGYGPVKEESVVSVKRHVNDKLGRVG